MNSDELVVLVHGLGRSKKAMNPLEQKLLGSGYRVWNKSYPSRAFSIQDLASLSLSPAVEFAANQGVKKIHFIGHSLGAILIRYYLQTAVIPNLGKVILIAGPNKGSELADLLVKFKIFNRILGPVLAQLHTGADSIPNSMKPIQRGQVAVIAGNRTSDPWFSPFISGPDDGKVSVEHAKVAEMIDCLILKRGHTWIAQSPEVLIQVPHFLKFARFH